MLVDYANGDKQRAQNFLTECPSIFDEYLTWIKENRTDDNKAKLDSEFIDKMSYQDVKDFLDKLQDERDKESKDKLAQMKFNQSNYSLVPIDSYDQMHKLYGGRATGDGSSDKYAGGGGTAWCHTNSESVYNGWVSGGNKFFVLQNNDWKNIPFDERSNRNNPKDAYGNSLIALLVDRKGRLKKATLRCNHVGVNSLADNQYQTYAELSEIVGFNVEEEVGKYVSDTKAIKLDEYQIVSIDLPLRAAMLVLPQEIKEFTCDYWTRDAAESALITRAYVIRSSGDSGIRDVDDLNGVRPCITTSDWVEGVEEGDIVEAFEHYWVAINPMNNTQIKTFILAPNELPLVTSAFSWHNSNQYEFSSVKHYIDDWFRDNAGKRGDTESPYFMNDDILDYVTEDDVVSMDLLSIEEAEELPESIRKYGGWWWLRSPGYISEGAASVRVGGDVSDSGYHVFLGGFVRPALYIKEFDDLYPDVGDVVFLANRYWAYIGNNKALLVSPPLGKMPFNKDVEKGNNYGTSDIKRILNTMFRLWFGRENGEI